MKLAESKLETIAHIETVRKYIKVFIDALWTRGINHDKSKLESPEAEIFASVNENLKNLTYGSDEYNENLKALEPALEHHRAKNRHHFEHHPNGVMDMNLIDLMEVMADWKASTYRQHNGNLLQTIDFNAEKYGLDAQLMQILKNTAVLLDNDDANK